MEAHGMFKIGVIGDVIHTYPSGSFNLEGMEVIQAAIYTKAESKQKWGLYEHPEKESGLTPEAVEKLIAFYKSLESSNCHFVCIDVDSLWEEYVSNLFQNHNLKNVHINPNQTTLISLQKRLN